MGHTEEEEGSHRGTEVGREAGKGEWICFGSRAVVSPGILAMLSRGIRGWEPTDLAGPGSPGSDA